MPWLWCCYRWANRPGICNCYYSPHRAERDARGKLIGPKGCGHGIEYAVYVNPETGAVLLPYSAG